MTTTADLVSSASAKIGKYGSAFYFVPATIAVGRHHGLDGFRFYFLGRGGVLGDVEPAVITSAFGYFHPAVVERLWTTSKERADISPRQAGRRYLECGAEFGRQNFAEVPGLQAFCDAAEKVNDAVDRAGLALYAGTAAEALPADLPGRAMQLITVLREFRGSAHLLAVLAVGLDPRVAHGIRRPDSWESFGHDKANLPAGTAPERALLADADALTDRLVAPAYGVLSGAEADALQVGLAGIGAAMPKGASIAAG